MKHHIKTFIEFIRMEYERDLPDAIELATNKLDKKVRDWEEEHADQFSILSDVTINIDRRIIYVTLISSEPNLCTPVPPPEGLSFNSCGCK